MLLEVSVLKVLVTMGVLIALFLGFLYGLLKDFTEGTVNAIGLLLALFAAHYIKNPVAVFFYNHLPFFNFFGPLEGITSFNILIYEFVAFLLVFIIIIVVLRILVVFTKIVDKLLNFVLEIGIPSNLISGFVSFIVTYTILFVFIYFGMSFSTIAGSAKSEQTFLDSFIKTPVLKETLGQPLGSMLEIANASLDYTNPNDLNYHALEILLKNEIISTKNAKGLIESGKITIKDSGKLVAKYEKK